MLWVNGVKICQNFILIRQKISIPKHHNRHTSKNTSSSESHFLNSIPPEKAPVTVTFLLGFCLSQAKSRHAQISFFTIKIMKTFMQSSISLEFNSKQMK